MVVEVDLLFNVEVVLLLDQLLVAHGDVRAMISAGVLRLVPFVRGQGQLLVEGKASLVRSASLDARPLAPSLAFVSGPFLNV